MILSKWDERFLALADHKATWSKDPSTQVGCVITNGNQDKYYGYNGFPQNIDDSLERLTDYELKQKLVIHAEMNAIFSAKESLLGHTLYCTHPPCIRCAVSIIRVGITNVICYAYNNERQQKKHVEDLTLVGKLFSEANIKWSVIRRTK